MKKKIEAYVPSEKIRHSEWRTIPAAPRGRIPCDISIKDLMRRRLRTKLGRKIYKLRQTTVEPVFGVIKEQFGLRQFLVRGLARVRSTWRLTCAVFNIMKLYRAGADIRALAVT